jgi:hypothetical protein
METTNSFYSVAFDGDALDISWKVFFEDYSDDMDGIFPRVNEWTRFANKIQNDGIGWWIEKHWKFYEVIDRIEKMDGYGDQYKIFFQIPLPIIFGQIWEKQIIENANGIEITISYEWYWTKNARQNKIANWISIFFEDIKAF